MHYSIKGGTSEKGNNGGAKTPSGQQSISQHNHASQSST